MVTEPTPLHPDADEMSVNIYVQKAMALATTIQTGGLQGAAAQRAIDRLADDTLAYLQGWKHADPEPTRASIVAILQAFEKKARMVQADFARVLGQIAARIEVR